METGLWSVIAICVLLIIFLLIKLYLFRKSAGEIEEAFADRLRTDTNTLIDISSGDKCMRKLADTINIQLRKLCAERHRFQQGDAELKNTVTSISHDLRTPLTAICGYLDLLEQENDINEVRRYVGIIRNRADMLTQLTEELFRYSLLNTAENEFAKEPVILNEVLEESAAAFYAALTGQKITPDIRLPEKKIVRYLDRAALSRVFSNLINNAMKYSDGDLHIILSETGEIIFANAASGLNEVQVGKLFDRFYTVEAARKSTGLGLAITRTLVERMHGTITAGYAQNRLCIRIQFPEEIYR